jgi:hypothetical protein
MVNLKKGLNVDLKKGRDIDLKKGRDIDLKKPNENKPDIEKKEPELALPSEGEVQKGLRQVGGTPIWTTPLNEPISPFDCERYSNSPYCGGNPFNTEDGIGVDVEVVRDECYVGIQMTGTLGWVKSPDLQIVIRTGGEECDPPKPPSPPKHPPRQPPPNINPDTPCWVSLYGYYYKDRMWGPNQDIVVGPSGTQNWKTSIKLPGSSSIFVDGDGREHEINLFYSMKSHITSYNYTTYYDASNFGERVEYSGSESYSDEETGVVYGLRESVQVIHYYVPMFDLNEKYYYENVYRAKTSTDTGQGSALIYYGYWKDLTLYLEALLDFHDYRNGLPGNTLYQMRHYEVIELEPNKPPRRRPPPPPPPDPRPRIKPPKKKKPKEEDMGCDCKKIYRELEYIKRQLGIRPDKGEEVSSSFLVRNGKKPGKATVKSMTQLFGYTLKNIYSVLGQWETEYIVNDIDPLKRGEQKEKIRLPNLASAVRDVHRMTLKNEISRTVTDKIIFDLIVELMSSKQIVFKNHRLLEAIIAYLGFTTKEKLEVMPMPYTPDKADPAEFLADSELEVSVLEFDGIVGQDFNLQDALKVILEAALATLASDTKKVGSNPNQFIKDLIDKRRGSDEDVEKNQTDFTDECRQIEQSFQRKPGMTEKDIWGI